MYPFVTHTWNVIKGKCPHDCSYCYMKRFKQSPLHFDEKELKTDLGEDNFIFVGSSCDMWAWKIEGTDIYRILEHCKKYPQNTYLLQSKNPRRFENFYKLFPEKTVLGTTLESNREYPEIYRNAPSTKDRYFSIEKISNEQIVMVTIEPILDFDLNPFIEMLYYIKPSWINIGADSKGHNLPEPPAEKIKIFIEELKGFTQVKIKKNLERIMKGALPLPKASRNEMPTKTMIARVARSQLNRESITPKS